MNANMYFEQVLVAARAVDRSHAGHHVALMTFVSSVAKFEIGESLVWLTKYVQNRMQESPKSLCTEATIRWLRDSFGLNVTKEGEVKRGKDWTKKGFTNDTFATARERPWYAIARDELVKPWSNPEDTMIKQYAVGFATGDIDEKGLKHLFAKKMVQAIVMEARNSGTVQDKAVKILKATLAA